MIFQRTIARFAAERNDIHPALKKVTNNYNETLHFFFLSFLFFWILFPLLNIGLEEVLQG